MKLFRAIVWTVGMIFDLLPVVRSCMRLEMASPKGLFRYATTAQLNAMLAAAIDRATNGQFTALSGAQKSSSKEWIDLQQDLLEINAELDKRNGVARVQKVVSDLNSGGFCGGYLYSE